MEWVHKTFDSSFNSDSSVYGAPTPASLFVISFFTLNLIIASDSITLSYTVKFKTDSKEDPLMERVREAVMFMLSEVKRITCFCNAFFFFMALDDIYC